MCINSNDKLVNSRKRLEANVCLVLLYSGNLYIFDEVTNQKYLELGKNLISDLETKICVVDDKSFESRKFAENALTTELNPDIKVRLLRNIITIFIL